jgi:hypothetical protein
MYLGRRLARGEQSCALRAGRWSNLRALGPYAVIALALPGGSLIALAMLGIRHRAALPGLRGLVLVLIVATSIALTGST